MAETALQTHADGATADAAILAAHERRTTAYSAMATLSPAQRSGAGCASTEELRLLRQINEAEDILAASIATTPAGAQAQLWAGLYRTPDCAEAHEGHAPSFCNFEHPRELDTKADWDTRLIVAGLRSLSAIETAHGTLGIYRPTDKGGLS